jgi:ADP-ribose pyrophosphatase YjhB (NUDIX family)
MEKSIYNQKGQLLAVDCIIFGYEDEQLKILLFKRWIEPCKGQWSLLGGWVDATESVSEANRRVLQTITGLEDIFMEMVDVFSEVNRDLGGRVVSIAYYAILAIDELNKKIIKEHDGQWFSLKDAPKLIFDHDLMVEKALEKLRLKANAHLIGEKLLPEYFTILQLRKAYNAIFQCEFDPGNFRKKILSLNVLEQMDRKDTSESRRGAYYYRIKPINELPNNGSIFKLEI